MRKLAVIGFASFLLAVFLFSFVGAASCPIQSDTNIVIYGETGAGGVGVPSRSWQNHFFAWWESQDPSINYQFLSKANVRTDCILTNYPSIKLYVQPGGDAYKQQNSLGSTGKNNILSYLDNGGAYFGACAGAYYAANDYYWQGSFYNHANLLDRFPTVEGSITSIADYSSSPGYAVTPIESSGRSFNMIYYGGPTRGWRDTPLTFPGLQAATFSGIPGSLPAAFANGNMLLTSIHAEAYENDGISGLSTADRIENYKWLANTINSVAGTSFYVPPYLGDPAQCADGLDNDGDSFIDYPLDVGCTSLSDNDEIDPLPAQCADGLDNDGDSFIDYPLDVGCTNALDNDETDVTGPVTLFSDDFESGTLSNWVLSRATGANNWISATTNPYQGVRYAESKPQSTTEPASSMELSVSTVGYSSVTFEYARRLIGLDVADEFQVEWFNGVSWALVEQTGSASANDAAYILRSFVLPSSAANNPSFKIRFECTAGAVSEFCRVDNVKVIGN